MSRFRAASILLRGTHRSSRPFFASCRAVDAPAASSLSRNAKCSYQNDSGHYTGNLPLTDPRLWMIFSVQAAIIGFSGSSVFAEDVDIKSSSGNDKDEASIIGLENITDGSIVSNIHTSKWRVFTDSGKDYFLQGKMEQAEKLFVSALQEAKEGFGERDPHVASACNNLAEFYRFGKEFDKAEPLYLKSISLLEDSYGPEDIRVGAALRNLGQCYHVQRKLEEARTCYERALKIMKRVLGHNHPDYAETMYFLGTVFYLQGKETDAEALILDSLKILEENDDESLKYVRRLRNLSQIYLASNRLAEAENTQRKILHVMELSKGWNSLDIASAAEALAQTLASTGQLKEAQELLERCLDARKTLLPEGHILIGASLHHIASVSMLQASQLGRTDINKAIVELDKAKDLIEKSARIAKNVLTKLKNQDGKEQKHRKSEETLRDEHAALVILLQSSQTLARCQIKRNDIQDQKEELTNGEEEALLQCISAYKEYGTGALGDSVKVKSEYLSCLKHLSALLSNKAVKETSLEPRISLLELRDERKQVEDELLLIKKSNGFSRR